MSDTSVVSVKVSPSLFDEVRRSKSEIDWPEELRAFMRERLRRLEAERILAKAHARHERSPARPRGFAAGLIRGDRDRH